MSEAPLDVEIDDPDNFSSSERLRHIYDARRQLREMRTQAATHRTRVPGKAVAFYRTGVESYLLELDTLMRQHPPGPEILYERDFGSVVIKPPGKWNERRHGAFYENQNISKNNKTLKVESLPAPVEVELEGVMSLLTESTPLEHTFEFERMNNGLNQGAVQLTGTAHIDWKILNWMVSAMNEFVSDLGLGLDVDEQSDWKI